MIGIYSREIFISIFFHYIESKNQPNALLLKYLCESILHEHAYNY